jgi:hypothetical protein
MPAQFWKAYDPIVLRLSGSSSLLRDEQLRNADSPMDLSDLGSFILLREVQLLNA